MACRICSRNNCCLSFHPIEAQEADAETHRKCDDKIERLEAEVVRLEKREELLDALEAGGVDNWEGYDECV